MDWVTIVIFFAGATCFTMALSFGGTVYAWDSGSEITFWVMTGVLLLAMIILTIRPIFVAKANRLYPGHFVRRPVLVNLQLQLFLATSVMMGTAYYIPLYFQFAKGDSALKAAVRLLPFIAMAVTFSIVNGALMPKFGYYMPWYTWGSALVLIGSALMYTIDTKTSNSRIYGYTVIMGIGAGSYLQAGYSVAQVLVPAEDVGNAVGFMSVAQDFGIVFMLGLAGSVYQNLAKERLRPILKGLSESDVSSVIAGTSNPVFQSLDASLQYEVVEKITDAISAVWAIMIGVGALCFVMSLFLGVSETDLLSSSGCMNADLLISAKGFGPRPRMHAYSAMENKVKDRRTELLKGWKLGAERYNFVDYRLYGTICHTDCRPFENWVSN